MADDKEKTRIDDGGIIIRDSHEYRALVAGLREMTALAERIPSLVKPALMGGGAVSDDRTDIDASAHQPQDLAELPGQRNNPVHPYRRDHPLPGISNKRSLGKELLQRVAYSQRA